MIKVNGKEIPWEEEMNIKSVLKACKYIFPQVVVKVNGKVVLRKDFETWKISDQDEIEVIHLIGGG